MAHEKKIKTFSIFTLPEFKEFLKNYFKITFEFELTFKSNNKNINLDTIGFDKKNNCYLTLKQLRLEEKSHIFITVNDYYIFRKQITIRKNQ